MLLSVALVLFLSGLFHLGVWAVDGGPWGGPVSWRKPIVFGLSAGVTTLSLAWVVDRLHTVRSRPRLARAFAVAISIEIALIAMQKWRNVPSHFNESTMFDAAAFGLMGLCIYIVSAAIVVWTYDVWRARTSPSDFRSAALSGLLLLNVSLLLGFLLVGLGTVALERNPAADPAVFGTAGQMKVPHALTLHGIQVLPILGWWLARHDVELSRRTFWIRVAATGYALLVVSALLQTFTGRAPLEASPISASFAVLGVILLGAPFCVALREKRRAQPMKAAGSPTQTALQDHPATMQEAP